MTATAVPITQWAEWVLEERRVLVEGLGRGAAWISPVAICRGRGGSRYVHVRIDGVGPRPEGARNPMYSYYPNRLRVVEVGPLGSVSEAARRWKAWAVVKRERAVWCYGNVCRPGPPVEVCRAGVVTKCHAR